MKKISPIKFFGKWGKGLLLFPFSSRAPRAQLSEIRVPEEHNAGAAVGQRMSFCWGCGGAPGGIRVIQEKQSRADRFFSMHQALGSWPATRLCVLGEVGCSQGVYSQTSLSAASFLCKSLPNVLSMMNAEKGDASPGTHALRATKEPPAPERLPQVPSSPQNPTGNTILVPISVGRSPLR